MVRNYRKNKTAGSSNTNDFRLRYRPTLEDRSNVANLLERTKFFSEAEIRIGVELVEEKLSQETRSSYCFVFAEKNSHLLGYSCYGPIPLTDNSYDLYWIAVDPGHQGTGIGKTLLMTTEQRIKKSGGRRVYVDTSSRRQYLPTRRFYLSCGYKKAARLPDFYRDGDGKIVFVKRL